MSQRLVCFNLYIILLKQCPELLLLEERIALHLIHCRNSFKLRDKFFPDLRYGLYILKSWNQCVILGIDK